MLTVKDPRDFLWSQWKSEALRLWEAFILCLQFMQRELNLDLEEAASQASWSLIGQVSCALDWVKTFVFWEGGVSRLGIYRMQGRIDAGDGEKKGNFTSFNVSQHFEMLVVTTGL